MCTNSATNDKITYTRYIQNNNTLVINELVEFINNLTPECMKIIKEHVKYLINTIQYNLNINGYININSLNHVINIFFELCNQKTSISRIQCQKFTEVIIHYAQHRKHYVCGATKLNWGNINYTKSISNIFEQFGIVKGSQIWDRVYEQYFTMQ